MAFELDSFGGVSTTGLSINGELQADALRKLKLISISLSFNGYGEVESYKQSATGKTDIYISTSGFFESSSGGVFLPKPPIEFITPPDFYPIPPIPPPEPVPWPLLPPIDNGDVHVWAGKDSDYWPWMIGRGEFGATAEVILTCTLLTTLRRLRGGVTAPNTPVATPGTWQADFYNAIRHIRGR
jgi:hypothetical protein